MLKKYFEIYIKPDKAFQRLLADEKREKISFYSVLFVAVSYSLVALFLYLANGRPSPEPFLRIPSENYFYWGTYFYALAIIFGWILVSGFMHLVFKIFAKHNSCENIFATTGLATGAATLITAIPDLIITFLQALGIMSYEKWIYSVNNYGAWFYILWAYMLAYAVYFLILYPKAVKAVYGLKTWQAIIVGLTSFIVYQFFIFLFIR